MMVGVFLELSFPAPHRFFGLDRFNPPNANSSDKKAIFVAA
jgi:hypothetical protein